MQTKPPAKVRKTQHAGNQHVSCRWKNISQLRTRTFIKRYTVGRIHSYIKILSSKYQKGKTTTIVDVQHVEGDWQITAERTGTETPDVSDYQNLKSV